MLPHEIEKIFFTKQGIRRYIMTEDFYCDEVLSGKTQVRKVLETENVLAYYLSYKTFLASPYCCNTKETYPFFNYIGRK